jgi:hypothetical protein
MVILSIITCKIRILLQVWERGRESTQKVMTMQSMEFCRRTADENRKVILFHDTSDK